MKQFIHLAAGFAALLAMHGALAGTIGDSFVGSDAHGGVYGDVIGNSTYDIGGASVTRVGSVLTVVINTNFAGNAGGNPSIGYGDLFLSSVWNPVGGTKENGYNTSDMSAGTVWKYALHIEDSARATNPTTGAALSLYQLNGTTNAANIWSSDHYLSAACDATKTQPAACAYRNNQAAGVNTDSTSVAKLATTTTANNKWTVGAGTVTFTMDVSNTALMSYSSFAIHWGETCQNDIIEGAVPEPSSLALLGAGVFGFMAMRRRRTA